MPYQQEILEAVKSGNSSHVSELLNSHPELLDTQAEGGESLLLLANYHRHPEIIPLLLAYNYKPDFHEAIVMGLVQDVKELLAIEPALLHTHAKDGFTPLGLASFFGHKEIVDLLLEMGADPNLPSRNAMFVAPIHSAVAIHHIEIARKLLESGANPNAQQQMGYTALHQAAHSGHKDMVEMLLTFKANPDVKVEDGRTPADLAREKGFEEIVELLA